MSAIVVEIKQFLLVLTKCLGKEEEERRKKEETEEEEEFRTK